MVNKNNVRNKLTLNTNGSKKFLNLGCGTDIRKGWVNVDCVENEGVDFVFDLDNFPYPFKDDEFDYILLKGIIEHLRNPEKAMCEIWRISKNNAKIEMDAPHFSCWQTWGDITHKRGFNHSSFNCFSDKPSHRGSSSLLNIKKEMFHIQSKIGFHGIKKFLGFELFVNLRNITKGIYERNFAYIFPATNIYFKLITIKKDENKKGNKN